MIIDGKVFSTSTSPKIGNGETIQANNCEYSTIRLWLNNEFYYKAFSEDYQTNIKISFVDNSVKTTDDLNNKYTSKDTNDKVIASALKPRNIPLMSVTFTVLKFRKSITPNFIQKSMLISMLIKRQKKSIQGEK